MRILNIRGGEGGNRGGGGRRENEAFMDNISRYPRDWWELEQAEKTKRNLKKQQKR